MPDPRRQGALLRMLSLAGLIVLVTSNVRCVMQSAGVSVEISFAAPDTLAGAATYIDGAFATVAEVELIPCNGSIAAALPAELLLASAQAHSGESPRHWTGSARIDPMSPDAPVGFVSPPAGRYCAVRVVLAPDEASTADPRLDPSAGRSLGVEGSYAIRDDGSTGFAVRTSARCEGTAALNPPLVLDEAEDRARLTLSYDAARWAESVELDEMSDGARQAALVEGFAGHLTAHVLVNRATPLDSVSTAPNP